MKYMMDCFILLVLLSSAKGTIDELKKHKNFNLLPQEDCGYGRTSNRIVGGKEASLGQYPWMAMIGRSLLPDGDTADDYPCGGAIISDLYIITAAHCEPFPFQWVEVRVGEHDTRNGAEDQDCDSSGYCVPPPQDIAISDYVCHPGYDKSSLHDDICIIRLAEPIKFGDSVQPICLPFYESILKDYLPGGVRLEVAGWGYYEAGLMEHSPVLLRLPVPVMDVKNCSRLIAQMSNNATVITNKQICAGGEKDKDSCQGDSGGPLMKPYSLNGPPRYFLIGVVSFGQDQCGSGEGLPAIYTDVRHYLKWILDNLPTDENIE